MGAATRRFSEPSLAQGSLVFGSEDPLPRDGAPITCQSASGHWENTEIPDQAGPGRKQPHISAREETEGRLDSGPGTQLPTAVAARKALSFPSARGSPHSSWRCARRSRGLSRAPPGSKPAPSPSHTWVPARPPSSPVTSASGLHLRPLPHPSPTPAAAAAKFGSATRSTCTPGMEGPRALTAARGGGGRTACPRAPGVGWGSLHRERRGTVAAE